MLNEKQRDVLAEKLMDAGNIAAGALLFAPFLSGEGMSLALPIAGLFICVLCYLTGVTLVGDRNDRKSRN